MAETFDLFEQLDKIGAAEGGGGGIVALTTISVGYKVYAAGVSQVETFFSFNPGNEAEKETAKASAEALAALHGVKSPRFGVQIVAHRRDALSRGIPVTWKDDRYFNTDYWTEACKQVVTPSVKAHSITQLPWTGWARIGFKPDPFKEAQGKAGMTDQDQAGNPRFPQVAYIVEVFPDEATAKAQAVANPEGAAAPVATAWKPESEGWDAESLKTIGKETLEQLLQAGKTLTEAAGENAMTVTDALVALGEHKTKLPPVAVANKYKVDVAEVSKVRGLAEAVPF